MTTFEQIEPMLSGVVDHGKYVSALCCFHEDSSPSMMVWKSDPPYFKCMSCGEHGSLSKLLGRLNGWTAPQVVSEVGGNSHHIHAFPADIDEQELLCSTAHSLLMGCYDPLANYLISRKVESCIKSQRLGYHKNWYTIPIYSREKQFLGMVGRASPSLQKSSGIRFDTPKNQGTLLYVPDWELVYNSEYLVVVFGMFDALTLQSIGIPTCTATAGKESTKADMFDWWRLPIHVIPDKGEEKTGKNLADKLGWRGDLVLLDYPVGLKDPADVIQLGQSQIIQGALQ